ncbi:MAG: rhomboid family intramembrane serine protease, partial [Flavobacteriales bacterium]|nr:rhomboid family intramembrane serine protease [Flavobacteriales bacterium]
MQIGSGRWSMMPPVVKNLLILNGLLFLATLSFQTSIGIDLRDMLGLHYFEAEKFKIYQIVTYMFMHGDFTHIFFNMFAVWMFGSAIENVWGSRKFLIYYLLTGFGAALIHYITIYIDIAPVISMMEQLVEDPSAQAAISFTNSHNWGSYLDQFYYKDMYDRTLEYMNGSLQVLKVDPENTQALRDTSNFFASYLEHFMNLPNVVGASGSLFGILLAFGMMFPNVRLFMIFIP